MKHVMFAVIGIMVCVSGFVFMFSGERLVITGPTKPVFERISYQLNRFKTYVSEKMAVMRQKVNAVRDYIQYDILLPLYIRFFFGNHNQE